MHTSQQVLLANELARTLRDFHSIRQYLKFTEEYSEADLRETLARVMAIPETAIKKSRGAYFTSLIRNYEKNEKYSGN